MQDKTVKLLTWHVFCSSYSQLKDSSKLKGLENLAAFSLAYTAVTKAQIELSRYL